MANTTEKPETDAERRAKEDAHFERLRAEMNEREWAWTAGARERGTL